MYKLIYLLSVFSVNFPADQLTNTTSRDIWISKQVTLVHDNFLDGINIDFESALPAANVTARDGLTALVKGAAKGIKRYISTGQVVFKNSFNLYFFFNGLLSSF